MNSLLRKNMMSMYSNMMRISSRSLSDSAVKDKIGSIVKNNKLVVFMKGDDAPRCGFSNAVVQIMRMHGVTYDSYDILADESLRQGIKDYLNWPTIPQVFINGEFVGGCDIMLQMHQSGELVDELKKVGLKSVLTATSKKEAQEKK